MVNSESQGIPAELVANEETGEKLAPDEDMAASIEEGLGDGTVGRVLKGPEQPTAAEIEHTKLRGVYHTDGGAHSA
eukprot:543830-Amphidinium_carterae.2